jgi:hypothetical protein
MNSKKYDNGAIWVACNECNHGGNGAVENKCSAGGHIIRWLKLGCFSGVLLPEQVEKIEGPVLAWDGVQDESVLRWHQENDWRPGKS